MFRIEKYPKTHGSFIWPREEFGLLMALGLVIIKKVRAVPAVGKAVLELASIESFANPMSVQR
jgi:hypothetical protein